jgi:hypothetical protein
MVKMVLSLPKVVNVLLIIKIKNQRDVLIF